MSVAAIGGPAAGTARRPAAGRGAALTVLGLVVVGLCVISVAFGTREVAFGEVWGALFGDADTVGRAAVVTRLPRTVLALLVGAALSVSGATMQAITRNPLAEPGLLGVQSGAALAVVIALAYFGLDDPYGYMAVAVLGAAVAAVAVYTVGSLGRGGATPLKLALAGAACSAAFNSLVAAVMLPRVEVMASFRFWQVGGVGGATWDRIGVVTPFLALGALVCLSSARNLNSLALGDEVATGLGTTVLRARLVAAVGAVLLSGVCTSVAGPIVFVGLAVPHVCRVLVGADHRWLLPFSAVGGAGLLVAADVIGRVVARPEEIEVGIVTAVIGAPVLVWVASRQKLRAL